MTAHYDVVIVGSGPVGATFARVLRENRPHARLLMVEAGPGVDGRVGAHTQTMDEESRAVAQMRSQGPFSDVRHEDGTLTRPGLFLVGDGAKVAGEFGMPAASMSSVVGGMGIHWTASSPHPTGSERIPFIPTEEMDRALDVADRLLRVRRELDRGDGVLRRLRDALGSALDEEGTQPVTFTPLAAESTPDGVRVSGTVEILGERLLHDGDFELRPTPSRGG